MSILAKAAVILLSLSQVMVVTFYTLDRNLQSGVYPMDADSISIPLFETASSLIIILLPLGLAFLLTNLKFFRKHIILLVGAVLYLAGAGLAALLAWSWYAPHHYSIFAAYVLLAAIATTLAILVMRNPSSNP